MQIKKIALYGYNGKRRDIDFTLSKLNIITGGSKRGKTSIIEIIDYCLGSSDCGIAEGPIKDTVEWFSILLQVDNQQIFIARKSPLKGKKTCTNAHLVLGDHIEIPENNTQISTTTNIDDIMDYLSSRFLVHEHITSVPLHQTRNEINLSFKHAKFFIFQNQDEIANKKMLFHRQQEPYIPQTIKDITPYFLGASNNDEIRIKEQLRQLKRQLKQYNKKLFEIKSLKGNGLNKGYELLAEAIANKINIDELKEINSDEELITLLYNLSDWKPLNSPTSSNNEEIINNLNKKRKLLQEEKRTLSIQLNKAEEYNNTFDSYTNANVEQHLRLSSINLFKNISESNIHKKNIILESLKKLDNEIKKSTFVKPNISNKISLLKTEKNKISEELKNINNLLYQYEIKNKDYINNQKLSLAQATTIGKIQLYIESINWNTDTSELDLKIKRIENKIANLESELESKNTEDILDSIINLIGYDMTKWAEYLKLEHSKNPIKLDLKKLTVIAETPNGKIPLSQMGSGENWVGYHLVTYLALAKWFITQNRPVPRFVVFDQPSQVYFPSDLYITGSINEIVDDEDRNAVKHMFKWLHDLIENELKNSLQIIVMDHADIEEPWFQNSIIDNKWRNNVALIPLNWIEENNSF
ncbi:DUF3732 domain-containing protein [Photobacterium leiognathi]|uniref:DUF3732 domain-containing protein n=1 Tax=Photobacterium leiognathi TaxID=553611 RepID=UPI001EE12DFB|nr:DUF3732 domain-containing protein [Photobacterium leiognathi]MCG3887094.1 DUF3732 domain-containing protein [Photobacterium leiognathi]